MNPAKNQRKIELFLKYKNNNNYYYYYYYYHYYYYYLIRFNPYIRQEIIITQRKKTDTFRKNEGDIVKIVLFNIKMTLCEHASALAISLSKL